MWVYVDAYRHFFTIHMIVANDLGYAFACNSIYTIDGDDIFAVPKWAITCKKCKRMIDQNEDYYSRWNKFHG